MKSLNLHCSLVVLSLLFGLQAFAKPAPVEEKLILECSTASQIAQIFVNSHLTKPAIYKNAEEFTAKLLDLYTENSLQVYSSVLLDSDVEKIRKQRAAAMPLMVFLGLMDGSDCSYFEEQAQTVNRAFLRFRRNLFKGSAEAWISELANWKTPTKEELQTRLATKATESDLRNRVMDVLSLETAKWVSTGKYLRKQSARHVILEFWYNLKNLERRLGIHAYDVMLKSLVAQLDSHSDYTSPIEIAEQLAQSQVGEAGLGLRVRSSPLGAEIVSLSPGSAAVQSKQLNAGDVILAVNGKYLTPHRLSEAVGWMRGSPGSYVTLTVGRAEKGRLKDVRDIPLMRQTFVAKPLENGVEVNFRSIDGKFVMTIKIPTFFPGLVKVMINIMSEIVADPTLKIDAIVLDLRDNPGGVVKEAALVAGMFLATEGAPLVGALDNDFTLNESDVIRGPVDVALYGGPLVVAINDSSASAAEIVAGTLRDYGRAVIVGGKRSFGKGTQQLKLAVPGIGGFTVTNAEVILPSGGTSQFEGISSDIVVPGPVGVFGGQVESDLPRTISPMKFDAPIYSPEALSNNRDKFLQKQLPVLRKASLARSSKLLSSEVTADTQIREIQEIAADYAKAVNTSCVLQKCLGTP